MNTGYPNNDDPKVLVRLEGRVAVVMLNDPAHLNPVQNTPNGSEEQLARALLSLEDEDQVRVIIIAGAGASFSAGADYRLPTHLYSRDETVMRALSASPVANEGRSWAMWYVLERCTKPLIAAVHGWTIAAGWEIALWCDMIVASEDAKFAFKEIDLGWFPCFGVLFAARSAGRWKAAELCYTGRAITAAEADGLGLVTRIVPAGEALSQAMRLAEEIAQHPMPVLAATRRALNRALATEMEWEMNRRDFALVGLTESSQVAREVWAERHAARRSPMHAGPQE